MGLLLLYYVYIVFCDDFVFFLYVLFCGVNDVNNLNKSGVVNNAVAVVFKQRPDFKNAYYAFVLYFRKVVE